VQPDTSRRSQFRSRHCVFVTTSLRAGVDTHAVLLEPAARIARVPRAVSALTPRRADCHTARGSASRSTHLCTAAKHKLAAPRTEGESLHAHGLFSTIPCRLFEYFYFNRVQLGHASKCTPCTPAQGTTVRIDHELCMTTTGIGPVCNGNVRFAPSGVQFGS
jgi:hypothetical protein